MLRPDGRAVPDITDCPINLELEEAIEHDVRIEAANSITLKPGVTVSGQEVSFSIGNCMDGTSYTKGFHQRSMDDYEYDVNGNLATDPNKKINISYNYLNLPYKVEWYEDGIAKKIEWLYDADGNKLRSTTIKDGVVIQKQDYFEGIEYTNDQLHTIYHSEGRAVLDESQNWQYQYILADYQGNNRVLFSNVGGQANIIAQWSYYPFGLEHQPNDTLVLRPCWRNVCDLCQLSSGL